MVWNNLGRTGVHLSLKVLQIYKPDVFVEGSLINYVFLWKQFFKNFLSLMCSILVNYIFLENKSSYQGCQIYIHRIGQHYLPFKI